VEEIMTTKELHLHEVASQPPESPYPTTELVGRHCFTIECLPDDIKCIVTGRVPGGTRLHVTYSGGVVRPAPGGPLDHMSDHGKLLSGGDWMLIRDDKVAVFDTRMTIRTNEAKNERERFVFDAVLSGVVDLKQGEVEPPPDWSRLTQELNVTLPIRFEVSGPKQDWVARRYRELAEHFHRYEILVRRPFLALGRVRVNHGQIESLILHVTEIVASDRGPA
jgi:hypothetical protein